MKTTGREYFYSVSGIMVPKYMVSDEFTEILEKFIETVPKTTESLERFISFDIDTSTFVDEMEKLYISLCSIHAHWLEVEAARILRLTEVNEGDLCRKLLIPFLTNIRTLAIDLQMAQDKNSNVIYHNRSQLERCNDVLSSMKIIISLLIESDFKKAFDIAKSVNELQDSEYIMPLISYITTQKQYDAIELAKEIRAVYKKKAGEIIAGRHNTGESKQILIVDDMPEVLTVVSNMLKEHYKVLAFKDSKEALKAIETKHQPDAFLLDIDMPKMDGFHLAKMIRRRAKFRTTPILFLTANSTKDNLVKSTEFLPTTFIVKPVNKDILISRLSGLLTSVEGETAQ